MSMTKPQARVREPSPPGANRKIRFHLVREGEPVPELAPPRLAKAKAPQAGQRRAAEMSMEAELHCPFCEVVIGRFDAGVYLVAGRCGPCHEALPSVPSVIA